jgi:hypothetical protein
MVTVVGDNGVGMPQQLSSTAVWLCELRRELQRYLVKISPSLLLFIDESAIDMSILPRLVKGTIEGIATWEQNRELMRGLSEICLFMRPVRASLMALRSEPTTTVVPIWNRRIDYLAHGVIDHDRLTSRGVSQWKCEVEPHISAN